MTALACAGAPAPGPANGWRDLIHDTHLGSILEAEKRAAAVNAALPVDAYGLSDLPQAEALLAAGALPLQRSALPGEWRCRSIQVNDRGVFAYPFFSCRIREEGGRLLFEKRTGSQRRTGELFDDRPDRMVFLGGQSVNDDPVQTYTRSGEAGPNDTAGLLSRIGDGRLRMLLDASPGSYELYELVR